MPIIPKHNKMYWEVSSTKKKSQNGFDYKSYKWKVASRNNIKLNPLCKHCMIKGIVKPAKHSDHIKSIRDGGDPYDLNNLQALCERCHGIKTQRDVRARGA